MSYLGDFRAGDTIDFKFCTVTTTGAPTQLAGTPAISVYKSNSTTQSTTGITLTVDFDGVTGLNHVRLTTGSDGTFYADGNDFDFVITTGTVGGTSVVGYVVGHFSLENRSALRAATAGRELVVDAAGLADANVVKVGPTGAGTAQTARDIGASVLLSSGTGTGQLDFTSGVVKANVTQYNGVAATSASGRPEVNLSHIAGVAVSTSTAQLGVNVVNFGGAAGTFASGRPEVNVSHWRGTAAPAEDTAGYPKVTIKDGTGTGEIDTTSGKVSIATEGITSGSFAAGAINAAAIATGAFDADALAADAVAEIAAGISVPTTAAIADAVHDEVVEGSYTLRQYLRLIASALFGKVSGANTATEIFRDTADSKARITSAVDSDGNRNAVTLDPD